MELMFPAKSWYDDELTWNDLRPSPTAVNVVVYWLSDTFVKDEIFPPE